MTLRSAYFRSWKGGPTVLFWGDAVGMRQLRDWLRSVTAPDVLAFESLCASVDGNEIAIKVVAHERDAGMRFGRDGLGSVEIQDSQIGTSMIQAPKGVWDAPIRFDGRSMGEDGAALFGQGHGPRSHRG